MIPALTLINLVIFLPDKHVLDWKAFVNKFTNYLDVVTEG
jgi:hypothetical protein